MTFSEYVELEIPSFDLDIVVVSHGQLTEVPPLIPEEVERIIEANKSVYLSHSSRCYKFEDEWCSVTELRFRVDPSGIKLEDHAFETLGEQYGLNEFGSEFSSMFGSKTVEFRIADSSDYYLSSQMLQGEPGLLVAEVCLCVEDVNYEYFKLPDLSFSPSRLLKAVGDPFQSTAFVSGHTYDSLAFEASFVEPKFYKKRGATKVVSLEDNLTELLELKLSFGVDEESFCNRPHNCRVYLRRLGLELYELRSSMSSKADIGLLHQFRIATDKRVLYNKECSVSVDASISSEFKLPKCLYFCPTPELGISFFSEYIARNYVLKATIEIECEHAHFRETLTTLLDINIAHEDSFENYPTPSVRMYEDMGRFLSHRECSSRDLFTPSEVASKLICVLKETPEVSYGMHDTTSILEGESIYSTTWIGLCFDPIKIVNHRKDASISSATHEGNNVSFYEVLRKSLPTNSRFAQYSLRINGRCIRSSFRWEPEFDLSGNQVYFNGSECKSLCLCHSVPSGGICCTKLEAWFSGSKAIPQEEGMNVVLGGEKVYDFLTLKFTFPLWLSSNGKPEPRGRLIIKRIMIDVAVFTVHNSLENVFESPRVISVSDDSLEYDLIKGALPEILADNDEAVSRTVPAHLYSVKLSKLSPTYYSNESSRFYKLLVRILVTTDHDTEWLTVTMPINIATNETQMKSPLERIGYVDLMADKEENEIRTVLCSQDGIAEGVINCR